MFPDNIVEVLIEDFPHIVTYMVIEVLAKGVC